MRSNNFQPLPQWRRLHQWVALLAGSIFAIVGAPGSAPTAVAQSGANQAGLVVLHGDGRVVTACVAFDEAEISGMALLQRSGLELNIDAGSGMGTVCRINGEGCSVPQESCFCRCEGASCTYWSYWRTNAVGWEYSNLGAGSSVVRPGDVEGWVWGQGQAGGAGSPPALTLAEICQATAAATATVSATPTATSQPTETPAATATPVPPATATPSSTPTATATSAVLPPVISDPPRIEFFLADRVDLAAGDTVTLQWRVVNAASVVLQAGGQAAAVDAVGTATLAPPYSVEVRLEASNSSGVSSSAIQLAVRTTPQEPAPVIPTPPPLPATAAAPAAPLTAAPLTAAAANGPLLAATASSPVVAGVQQRIQLPLIMKGDGRTPVAPNATPNAALTAGGEQAATPTPPRAAEATATSLPIPAATTAPATVPATATGIAWPATAMVAGEPPAISAGAATESALPIGRATLPAAPTTASGLAGAALAALAVLLFLPAGIGVGVYLLWRAAKMTSKR